MGRFFDAIASLCGVRQVVNYEAQAAIELEAMADPDETGEYHFIIEPDGNPKSNSLHIDASPLIEEVLIDLQRCMPVSKISARFHNSVARMVHTVCNRIRQEHAVKHVVLSGGVWQNQTLLQRTNELLASDNFIIQIHRQVPTNDGGLALGQAVVAIQRMMAN
jgi:hydrogenase maturation protein HypF